MTEPAQKTGHTWGQSLRIFLVISVAICLFDLNRRVDTADSRALSAQKYTAYLEQQIEELKSAVDDLKRAQSD